MNLLFPLNNIALQACSVSIIIYSIGLIMVPRQSTISDESALLAMKGNGVVPTCLSIAALYMQPSLYLSDIDAVILKKDIHQAYFTFSIFTGILIGTFLVAYQARDVNSLTPCHYIGRRYHPLISILMSFPFLFAESISLIMAIWFLWSQYRTSVIICIPMISYFYTSLGGIDRIVTCDSIRFLVFFIGLIVVTAKLDLSDLKEQKIHALITNYKFTDIASVLDRYLTIAMFTAARPSFYCRVLAVTRTLGAPLASIIGYLFSLLATGAMVVLTIILVYKDWIHKYSILEDRPDEMHALVCIFRLLGDGQYYITAFAHVIMILTAGISCDASFFSIKSILSADFFQILFPKYSFPRLIATSCGLSLVCVILFSSLIYSGVIYLTYRSSILLYLAAIEYTYIVLVPQTICVYNISSANGYGAAFGFWIGTILFCIVKVEAVFELQLFKNYIQPYFPVNTLCAIVTFLVILGVSLLAKFARKYYKTIRRGDIEIKIAACGIKDDEEIPVNDGQIRSVLSSVYQDDDDSKRDLILSSD